MNAEIICVGTELLLGDILNTNTRFLARELADIGINVLHQHVVGDNPQRLEELVKTLMKRSELLVFSGGLGPTADDLSKETIARCFGDELVLEPKILKGIAAFFASLGKEMPQNNEKQAMVPKNGGWIDNPNGTAPGVWFEKNGVRAILLPGPPKELEPLFKTAVRPMLKVGQTTVLHSLMLRVAGVGESHAEELIGHLLDHQNPTAAIYAKSGEVQIRITASAQNHKQAETVCRGYAQNFYDILGDRIYAEGETSLEQAAVAALLQKGLWLATAESCTGGLVSQRITAVAGASECFGFGFVTYANAAKEKLLGVKGQTLAAFGAVSPETAAEMAVGAQAASGADIAVALTGIAGPGGSTPKKPVGLVYLAAAYKGDVYVQTLQLGQRNRETVRWLASQWALDTARRLALGLPLPAGGLVTTARSADETDKM